MNSVACPGCQALFPEMEGPTHRYIESSPACWEAYGKVLAREYSDPEHMSSHRMTVDAYSVQHPGQPSRQSINSVAGHLTGLYSTLVLGRSYRQSTLDLKRVIETQELHWLEPPTVSYAITVQDILKVDSAEDHAKIVRAWAECSWQAWAKHHEQIFAWSRCLSHRS